MAIFQFNPFRPSESTPHLHLLFWGKEDCVPGHPVGPGIRDVYKIHFIHKGKGIVRVGTETHLLVAGQAFLIIPNVVYYYEADHDEPWTYSWIGFEGTVMPEILSRTLVSLESPVFAMDNRMMPTLYDQLSTVDLESGAVDLRLQAILYDFMAAWVEVTTDTSSPVLMSGRQESYVHQTLEFLHTHYSEDISLESHAERLGLDRKHLSVIFKKALDVPPRQYLLHYRMNKACELLSMRDFTVGEVARSVGYQDPLLFSRMFKKVLGVSPKKYRNNLFKSDINP